MRKRRAGGDVKPEKGEKSIKVKKPPFDLNAPAIEMFRVLGIPEISKGDGKFLEGITALEAIGKAASVIFDEAAAAAEECKDHTCQFSKDDPLRCDICHDAELKRKAEGIEQRMNNASWLIRHALGGNKIGVNCPYCRRWTYLELDGEQKRWVCKDCRKKPF